MKITLGSELLDNYRGDIITELSNVRLFIKNSDNQYMPISKKSLPIGEYEIIVVPELNYLISTIKLNGQSIPNNYKYNIVFGTNMHIEAVGAEISKISDFTFSGSNLTGYLGTASAVNIPGSYSVASDGSYVQGNSYQVTSIASNAFQNKDFITLIELPNTLTTINGNAFYGCTGLTSITIPDSVTSIGSSAFYNCTNLEKLYLGAGVSSIGTRAFYSSSSKLSSIEISDENPNYIVKDNCLIDTRNNTLILGYPYITNKLPNDATSIGTYAVSYSTAAIPNSTYATLEIPESYTSINTSGIDGWSIRFLIFKSTTPPTLVSSSMSAFSGASKILVPSSAVDTYRTANN